MPIKHAIAGVCGEARRDTGRKGSLSDLRGRPSGAPAWEPRRAFCGVEAGVSGRSSDLSNRWESIFFSYCAEARRSVPLTTGFHRRPDAAVLSLSPQTSADRRWTRQVRVFPPLPSHFPPCKSKQGETEEKGTQTTLPEPPGQSCPPPLELRESQLPSPSPFAAASPLPRGLTS